MMRVAARVVAKPLTATRAIRLVATLSMLLAVACTSGDRPGSVATVVDSSAGYPVYLHSGTPAEWRAELITTVGADTGGVYEFGQVRSVVLDSHGRLYVLEPVVAQVSVFDSTGEFLGTRGRKGRGPGELLSPESIAMLHDSLVVYAPSSRRFILFAPDGELARDWPAPVLTAEFDRLLYRTPPDAFWNSTVFRQDGGNRRALIRHPTGGTLDTIDNHRPIVTGPPPITCPGLNGGFSWYDVPFGPAGYSRPIGNGEQALVISSAYRIAIVGRDGDTLRVIEREAQPSPIADADWEAETAKFRAWRAERGNPSCTRNEFERPPARPVVEWMFMDDEGHLWVETYSPDGSVYEVFGRDGSLLAAVTGLPPSLGVDPSVANGRIAFYSPDANDIPRVQVFRIRKP